MAPSVLGKTIIPARVYIAGDATTVLMTMGSCLMVIIVMWTGTVNLTAIVKGATITSGLVPQGPGGLREITMKTATIWKTHHTKVEAATSVLMVWANYQTGLSITAE